MHVNRRMSARAAVLAAPFLIIAGAALAAGSPAAAVETTPLAVEVSDVDPGGWHHRAPGPGDEPEGHHGTGSGSIVMPFGSGSVVPPSGSG